jgi:putative spermidine/putrescine transport system permease protein
MSTGGAEDLLGVGMTSASISVQPGRFVLSGLVGQLKGSTLLLLPAAAFLAFIYLLPVDRSDPDQPERADLVVYFERVFAIPLYWDSLVRTMQISVTRRISLPAVGYPTALLIHRSRGITQVLIATAIVLPYFIAILIRTYALDGLAWPQRSGQQAVDLGRHPQRTGATPLHPRHRAPVHDGGAPAAHGAQHLFQRSAARPKPHARRVGKRGRTDCGVLAGSAAADPAGHPAQAFFLVFVTALGFFITPTLLGGRATRCLPCTSRSRPIRSPRKAFSRRSEWFSSRSPWRLSPWPAVSSVSSLFGAAASCPRLAPARAAAAASGAGPGRRTVGTLLADMIGWPLLRLLGRLPASCGVWTVRGMGGLVIAVLILPIVVVMIISFSSASYLTFPPPGFFISLVREVFLRFQLDAGVLELVDCCRDVGLHRLSRSARRRRWASLGAAFAASLRSCSCS